METCQRKVNSYSVSRSVYLMSLFDWRLVREEKKDNAPSILTFERNTDTPYYQEMVEIEKETSPKLLPFWVLLIFVGIAFALVTASLIITLLKVPGFDPLKTFLIFFIPASICLFIDVILFYLRSKQMMKYLQNEKEIVANAENKMAELRKRYGNQK
ncbi:MAG: hypothetical protein IJR08_04860 [Bacilli bacterium]|nr:hypothetical protein [Bacilli bacterium]